MKLDLGRYKGVFDKYKYLLLVICAGVLLMLWPSSKANDKTPSNAQAPPAFSLAEMEQKVASALLGMDGVGRVQVALTLKNDGQTVYQTDAQTKRQQEQSDGQTSRETTEQNDKTLVVSEGSGVQQPAVVRQELPQFLGAVIVCDGANDSAVVLKVSQAVAALTGLSSDRITVVKMKS